MPVIHVCAYEKKFVFLVNWCGISLLPYYQHRSRNFICVEIEKSELVWEGTEVIISCWVMLYTVISKVSKY